MTVNQPAPPGAPQQTMAGPVALYPSAIADHDGWTTLRLEVINDAAGVCARCGMDGADTVVRGWGDEKLTAAHTRCVVGLGPVHQGRGRL